MDKDKSIDKAMKDLKKSFEVSLCLTQIRMQFWYFESLCDKEFMKNQLSKCYDKQINSL